MLKSLLTQLLAGLSLALAGSSLAAPTTRPTPLGVTYGDDKDVPLPNLVGGSDLAIVDWDGNGTPDLLVSPDGGRLIFRRNIGTKQSPRFANVFQEETSVLTDERLGRFFAMIHKPGVEKLEARGAVIAFERLKGIPDIGKTPLHLNLFVPQGNEVAPTWKVIEAKNVDGSPIEEFADIWMSPAVETVDWNGDGLDDLVVGAWHPSLSQPAKKYSAGFNLPDDSWVGDAGRLYVMINRSHDGQLIFEKPKLIECDGKPITAYGAIFPRCLDLDGDSQFDLVVSSHKPGVAWYRNVGTKAEPKFERGGEICDDADKPIHDVLALRMYFGDLNGDGKLEMLAQSYFAFSMGFLRYDHVSGDLSTGWKRGDYLPMAGDPNTPLFGQGICSPETVDWNGDGKPDLLLGSEPCAPMISLNTGTIDKPIWSVPQRLKYVDGSPLEYHAIEIGRGSVWGPIERYLETVQPRLADWDGDGTLDMITGAMGARTLWLRGQIVDGELRFEKPRAFTMKDGSPRDVAHRIQPFVIDWDHDGHLDLIDCDTDNIVTLWPGDGTERLGAPKPFLGPDGKPLQLNPSHMPPTSGRRCLAMVDWNKDGVMDLISYDAFTKAVWGGAVRLHLGIKDKPMQFEKAIDLFPIISHHQGGIALMDWDHDGLLDIVTGGDHTHMPVGSNPRGQIFVFFGKNLPVPPAPRPASEMAVPNALAHQTSASVR